MGDYVGEDIQVSWLACQWWGGEFGEPHWCWGVDGRWLCESGQGMSGSCRRVERDGGSGIRRRGCCCRLEYGLASQFVVGVHNHRRQKTVSLENGRFTINIRCTSPSINHRPLNGIINNLTTNQGINNHLSSLSGNGAVEVHLHHCLPHRHHIVRQLHRI